MNREILLVQPKAGSWENLGIRPPDGLLTISAMPYNKGYNIKIVDLRLESDWRAAMKSHLEKNPLFVATSCMTGPQIAYALELSNFVKQHDKNIPVIWGGIHPSLFPEQVAQDPLIDYAIYGEAENNFPKLLDCLVCFI